MRGAFVGGIALGLLEQWGATVLGGQWKDVFAFVVLVLVLMFRPIAGGEGSAEELSQGGGRAQQPRGPLCAG